MPTLVLASGNAGKLKELSAMLSPFDFALRPQSDFDVPPADETGQTFAENSLLKARHAAAISGCAAIADDSGLSVDALGGAPGVYSARYAGDNASDDDNIDHLLAALGDRSDRSAAFHCVISLVRPGDPDALVATGIWRGEILRERRGSGGFGYDPVFFDRELARASAELSAEEKNAVSHRARAMAELKRLLEAAR